MVVRSSGTESVDVRVAGRQVALRCSLMDSPTTMHRDREVQLTASNGWGAPTRVVCRHGRRPEPVRTTMPAVADVATELPTATQDPTAGQETSRKVAAVVEICWLDQTAPPLSVVSTTPCPDLALARVVEVVPTTVQRTPATPTGVVVGVVVAAGVVVVVAGTELVAEPVPGTDEVDGVGLGAVVAGEGRPPPAAGPGRQETADRKPMPVGMTTGDQVEPPSVVRATAPVPWSPSVDA